MSAAFFDQFSLPFYTYLLIVVLHFIVGKYMQMMIVLKPIAFDVILYMTQLFDYYLYSVSIYILFFYVKL